MLHAQFYLNRFPSNWDLLDASSCTNVAFKVDAPTRYTILKALLKNLLDITRTQSRKYLFIFFNETNLISALNLIPPVRDYSGSSFQTYDFPQDNIEYVFS